MSTPTPTKNGHADEQLKTEPEPVKEENRPDEAAPRLDRPSGQNKEAAEEMWRKTKEKASTVGNALGSAFRSVQDTNPEAVARRTSQKMERGTAEVANFTKAVVTTSISFAGGMAIGLARGGPTGVSDKHLERLRVRDGSGSLVEVGRQKKLIEYEEDGITKKGVTIQFLEAHADLAPGVRADDSELPEGQAFIPFELAYEETVKTGEQEIEAMAVPLTGEDEGELKTFGFLVLARAQGDGRVFAYRDDAYSQ